MKKLLGFGIQNPRNKKLFTLALLLPGLALAAPSPGDFFASGPREQKRIALTFDDGPGPHTEKFIALLEKYGVKGTFFMSGDQVRNRKMMAKKVADAGHEVASHTMSHINYRGRLSKVNDVVVVKKELIEDMRKSRAVIKEASGVNPQILRMPHGIDRPWIKEAAKEVGFILVNWTHGADWKRKPEEQLAGGYIQAIQPGAILLFHDGGRNRQKSLALTEAVLIAAKEKGYDVVPVGELIGVASDYK